MILAHWLVENQGRQRQQRGQALLGVLVILLAVSGSAASFIWFMNQQQTRVGQRYRSMAALNAAEAGVHRALGFLETASPDGQIPGRDWQTPRYADTVRVGSLEARFTVSVQAEPSGARVVTSVGEVGGVTRRIRVRVHLASPALLAALNGAGIVKIEPQPAATLLVGYGAGTTDLPWIHIMAGRAVWFTTGGVSVNDPNTAVTLSPGPVDPVTGQGGIGKMQVTPLRIALARNAILAAGAADLPADVTQLRAFGISIEEVVSRSDDWPAIPGVDKAYYQSVAAANIANAAINTAAGRYASDEGLARKTDSEYSGADFLKVTTYLTSVQNPPHLRGVIYIHGIVFIPEGAKLQIQDGALITESTVHLSRNAGLSIVHSSATRTLPGMIVLDLGKLTLAQGARLQAHGLVYANRSIEAGDGATLDVVGAVLGNDPGLSFRTSAATTGIRYDPAVLGTPGLVVAENAPVVAWIASWEEVP